jgi:hypothetical protein
MTLFTILNKSFNNAKLRWKLIIAFYVFFIGYVIGEGIQKTEFYQAMCRWEVILTNEYDVDRE